LVETAATSLLEPQRVDRSGGVNGAGVIIGCAVVSVGEASGHGLWLDLGFVGNVADAINAAPEGIKCRFTHPGLCADGLGTFLGRLRDAYLDQETVRADLHLDETAAATPNGDLASYCLNLAESDPAAFGLSIVFTADEVAEAQFEAAHLYAGSFQSPDRANTANLPHARLAKLHAADVVDEPAANPSGMFGTPSAGKDAADLLIDYALGLSSDRPGRNPWGIYPDRLRRIVSERLHTVGATLTLLSEAPMTTPKDATNPTFVEPTASPAPAPTPDPRGEAQQFRQQFGEAGLAYWADGLSLADAQIKHRQHLEEQLTSLRAQLAAKSAGLDRPIQTADQVETAPAPKRFGRERFAAAIAPQLKR